MGSVRFAVSARKHPAWLIDCVPWGRKRSDEVTYIITQGCIDLLDKTCIEECPVDCIYEGERMMYIHPDECVDCGAC
jgi:NAD-dependent dihydropyrimidine dehydrogenase PreA subunit